MQAGKWKHLLPLIKNIHNVACHMAHNIPASGTFNGCLHKKRVCSRHKKVDTLESIQS